MDIKLDYSVASKITTEMLSKCHSLCFCRPNCPGCERLGCEFRLIVPVRASKGWVVIDPVVVSLWSLIPPIQVLHVHNS